MQVEASWVEVRDDGGGISVEPDPTTNLPRSTCPPSLYVLNEYTNKRDIRDPWGRDYQFTCDPTTREMVVFSGGEDGRLGTSDDIRTGQ